MKNKWTVIRSNAWFMVNDRVRVLSYPAKVTNAAIESLSNVVLCLFFLPFGILIRIPSSKKKKKTPCHIFREASGRCCSLISTLC